MTRKFARHDAETERLRPTHRPLRGGGLGRYRVRLAACDVQIVTQKLPGHVERPIPNQRRLYLRTSANPWRGRL